MKPSCRGRGGGRRFLFSAKGDPQSKTVSRNCLLLFQSTSMHAFTIPRQSSLIPGSSWRGGWVSNQSPHREGYTQKRARCPWCPCPPLWTLERCYKCHLMLSAVSDDWLCLCFTCPSQQPRREGNFPWMLEQALAKFTVPLSLRLYLPS